LNTPLKHRKCHVRISKKRINTKKNSKTRNSKILSGLKWSSKLIIKILISKETPSSYTERRNKYLPMTSRDSKFFTNQSQKSPRWGWRIALRLNKSKEWNKLPKSSDCRNRQSNKLNDKNANKRKSKKIFKSSNSAKWKKNSKNNRSSYSEKSRRIKLNPILKWFP
jgi:hypothetical protein